MPVAAGMIPGALTTLETRLSAARAGYLDNINQAGLLDLTAARVLALSYLGRALEGYTPTIAVIAENDANYVTVLDITGRGMLFSIGTTVQNNAAARVVTVRLTLDGGVVINAVDIFMRPTAYSAMESMPLLLGFDTSCLLEMKGDAALTAGDYVGVALTE